MERSRQADIDAVRNFNRAYTNLLGLLDRHILDSGFSLPEARVLYGIDKAGRCTAKTLTQSLKIDAGYLSRILKRLEGAALLKRSQSATDGRAQILALTPQGSQKLRELNRGSDEQIGALLDALTDADRESYLRGVSVIERALSLK